MAPIRLVKALLPALRQSENPKIVFMGALSGRDNFPGREVAADNLSGNEAIPLTDLLSIMDCILSLSRATCIKEIDVPAMRGTGD